MSASFKSPSRPDNPGADRPGVEPLVGIGIPVYNGARSLRVTLDALLAQTLPDFEILISDNGSTDETPTICAEYAARDSRIRYTRQPRNLGLPNNWNFVARQARGKYFKWASSNDLLAPEMLAACIGTLESDRDAVLAFGHTTLIGALGERISNYESDFPILDEAPSARFRAAEAIGMNNAINGVIRRSALLQTGLIRPYPASDYVLMAELALHGKFKLLPQTLFFRRTDAGSITTGLRRIDRLRLHDPAATGRETIELRRYADLMRVSITTPGVPWRERLKCLAITGRFALWARHRIVADLVEAARSRSATRAQASG
jgi:glycosyltransferase involved in cell wall biosynthesis